MSVLEKCIHVDFSTAEKYFFPKIHAVLSLKIAR